MIDMCQSKADGGRRCPSSNPVVKSGRAVLSHLEADVHPVSGDGQHSAQEYLQTSQEWVNGLSTEQRDAVEAYVNQEYSDINEALWKGRGHEKTKHLDEALDVRGEQRLLYRKLALNGDRTEVAQQVSKFKVGETITFEGYTSTSQTPNAMIPLLTPPLHDPESLPDDLREELDTSYRNVVAQIVTDRGAPVSALSHMPQEQEYLLGRGHTFRVLKIQKDVDFTTSENLLDNSPGFEQKRKATVIQLIDLSLETDD